MAFSALPVRYKAAVLLLAGNHEISPDTISIKIPLIFFNFLEGIFFSVFFTSQPEHLFNQLRVSPERVVFPEAGAVIGINNFQGDFLMVA